ncbi:MAG: hypothetical protein IBJ15_01030 [Alphaproteobacteria bacterium]|nr:hypothetical protein [Alphaproteobacteria bacterium]
MSGHVNKLVFSGSLAREPLVHRTEGKMPFARAEIEQIYPYTDGKGIEQQGSNRQTVKVFGDKGVKMLEAAWKAHAAASEGAPLPTFLFTGKLISEKEPKNKLYYEKDGKTHTRDLYSRVLIVDTERDGEGSIESLEGDLPAPKKASR